MPRIDDVSNHVNTGSLRRLLLSDRDLVCDHLMRLDKETRRLRFAHSVSDYFVKDYASRILDVGDVYYGWMVDCEVRGLAELRQIGFGWGSDAEAAFSVERQYQNLGVGNILMGRVIRAARNRMVKRIYLSCLAENSKMQSIARKHDAELKFEFGEVIGEIIPTSANYFSVIEEAVEDRMSFALAVLELQERLTKAA